MNVDAAPAMDPHDPPGLQDFQRGLHATSEHLVEHARQRFDELLPRIVRRITGSEQATQCALADGALLVDGCTVVIRYNEHVVQIEFFGDVGLPEPHDEQRVYRTALEYNLCRTYPGLAFGVHPESGRLVATTALHLLLVEDEEVCAQAAQSLAAAALEVRQALGLAVP